MPAITNTSSKILITGGSGFLGAWIIRTLLEAGYNVRTTVRTPAKAKPLQSLFHEYPSDRLEFAYVQDVQVAGAFDKAVEGVDGVIHSASPLPDSDPNSEPSATINPAVNGTVGILKSIQDHGQNVKRVVITSSIAAVREPHNPGYHYTENDWNDSLPKLVEKQGREANPFYKYAASKSLAERAAWKWMEENLPSFDMVTILPSFILGPILGESSPNIGGSNELFLDALKKSAVEGKTKFDGDWDFVDVRSSALHHVKALEIPQAGGQRILGADHVLPWQEIVDILNAESIEGLALPKGLSGTGKDHVLSKTYSTEKTRNILQVQPRDAKVTLVDTVKYALKAGWTQ